MKKITKLLSVLLAIAVIICPMMSAVVVNAEDPANGYSLKAGETANTLELTINSTEGFLVYQATVAFEGDVSAVAVKDYTILGATPDADKHDSYNLPIVTSNKAQDGKSITFIVSSTDASNLDFYTSVVVELTVTTGTTAKLTKIQAANDGTSAGIEADAKLLEFPGVTTASDGTINQDDDYAKENAAPHVHSSFTYASNKNGTHTATCTGCDYSKIEDCDEEGTDGACSKCGYKAATEPEKIDVAPVAGMGLGDSVYVSYNFLASKLSGYDDFYLKVEKQVKDSKWDLVDGEPFYIRKSDMGSDYLAPSGSGASMKYYFYFRSIELYSLSVPVKATLYCLNDGKVVAIDEFDDVVPAIQLKTLHANAVQKSRDKMATAITDVLVAGDEAVKYFTRNNKDSDYAKLPSPIADYNTSDASTSLINAYNLIETTYSGSESAVLAAGLNASPYISFRIKPTAGSDISQYKVKFSYFNPNTGKNVYSETEATTFQYSTSNQYYYAYCRNIAMYCADADVTIEVYKDDVVVGTAHYSLEMFYSTNDSDATMGAVISALARMGQSFKAYKLPD